MEKEIKSALVEYLKPIGRICLGDEIGMAEDIYGIISQFINQHRDWENVPEWANYIATDWNGTKHAFENEPTCEKSRGVWLDNGGKWEVIRLWSDKQIWVESLKKRPQ